MQTKKANKNIIKLFTELTPPFVIAEMSGNHRGSLDNALNIVRAAAEAKVAAIKIQTFTADTMTININRNEFMANSKGAWKGKNLYQLYQESSTPMEWHAPIFELCAKLGIFAFSSPFDPRAVDFLETLNVPFYKLASFEIIDIPLVEKIAKTGKPMIISTGMATEYEIQDAVSTAKKNGCKTIILLKCTSAYPSDPKDINLSSIPYLKKRFNCPVGLSDHSLGVGVSIASVAYGASVIEKHLTLDRSQGGVDHSFSMEPDEMKLLVQETARAWYAKGIPYIGPVGVAEKAARLNRRSIYVIKDILEKEIITNDNIRSIRPGYGLHPRYLKDLLGKKAIKNIKKGTPTSWDLFE